MTRGICWVLGTAAAAVAAWQLGPLLYGMLWWRSDGDARQHHGAARWHLCADPRRAVLLAVPVMTPANDNEPDDYEATLSALREALNED
jgi:hypothetical protein